MKKLAILLLAMVLLIMACGCQKAGYKPDLPDADIESIEKAYKEKFGEDVAWFNPETGLGDLFYIGTDSGYLLLIDNVPNMGRDDAVRYGNEDSPIYMPPTKLTRSLDDGIRLEWIINGTQYYAFKDGEFIELPQFYRDGGITKDGLAKAVQYYNDTYSKLASK
ncbi:MAG: hypothetical protein IJN60_02170 [Oscillospiraceae bacterium]|nr:hypothetical protein [Oscillospiraceae bacterium]